LAAATVFVKPAFKSAVFIEAEKSTSDATARRPQRTGE
jgi:hypothetical protein